jgi:primosomal protein N' (replication factor Y)
MTDAEQALWKELRKYRLGWRYRRQFPIPPYIVDFACVDARLMLEADGGQHERPGDHELRDNELGGKAGASSASGTTKSLPTLRE